MKSTPKHQLWGIVLADGEGTRVREFLAQVCGGRGIKQFCAVTGCRSMLQHTLDRVEQLIPRERTLIVVSTEHRAEVEAQLSHWPAENLIFQPANRDTAPGILLPLAHVSHRAPLANVAIFPSDHCIRHEARFMRAVSCAVAEVERFPRDFILFGMTPETAEEGYGWIEPSTIDDGRATRGVLRFWEKPDPATTHALLSRGALWNTFVCVAWAPTIWNMVRQVAPDLDAAFANIRHALGTPAAAEVIVRVYASLRSLNFSPGFVSPSSRACACCPCPMWAGMTGAVYNASATRWRRWGNSMSCSPAYVTTKVSILASFLSRTSANPASVYIKPNSTGGDDEHHWFGCLRYDVAENSTLA